MPGKNAYKYSRLKFLEKFSDRKPYCLKDSIKIKPEGSHENNSHH